MENTIDKIIESIENSPIWKDLNNKCKEMYKTHNKVPSEKEYRALRNILICKVMLEDTNVYDMLSEFVWKSLQ